MSDEGTVTDDVATIEGTVTIEGRQYRLIPYGSEAGAFDGPCHHCGAELETRHSSVCPMGPGRRYQRPPACRDCGRSIGQLHVLNCGIERCPHCAGQYATCGCVGSEDAPDEDDGDWDPAA